MPLVRTDLKEIPVRIEHSWESPGSDKHLCLDMQILEPDLHSTWRNAHPAQDGRASLFEEPYSNTAQTISAKGTYASILSLMSFKNRY